MVTMFSLYNQTPENASLLLYHLLYFLPYLHQDKSSFFLILKYLPFRLIVHVINTSFCIHFPFFVYWKTHFYIRSPELLWVVCWLVWCEPRQRIQAGWMPTKEAGFCCNRMVHALFTHPPFLWLSNNMEKVKWVELLSLFQYYHFFAFLVVYLPCIIWKSVGHNQPLLRLAPSCFFPLTLILRTLLNLLYYCFLKLESQRG